MRLWLTAVLCACVGGPCPAEMVPLLPTNHCAHLDAALDTLNMSRRDLGFDKNVAEPRVVLERVRSMLSAPLDLPVMAGEVLDSLQGGATGYWELAARLLELTNAPVRLPGPVACPAWPEAGPALSRSLDGIYTGSVHAAALLDAALAQISAADREHLAAAFFAGIFNAEDHADVRAAMRAHGFASNRVEAVIREALEVDPAPAAARFLAAVARVDRAALLAAGEAVTAAARSASRQAADVVAQWPPQPRRYETPLGCIVVGTRGPDIYTNACLAILDPGGDDTYSGKAGSADGVHGHGLATIVDLGGDDRYLSSGLAGAGTAVFGVAALVDVEGNDLYQAAYAGQAAALFGCAWLEDRHGADVYRAHALAQAAAHLGAAMLYDAQGRDLYEVGLFGQAFAGVLGAGILLDAGGNDRYLAGGRRPDYERRTDRYQSLAQGCALGMRPFAGGGVAALVDLAGSDIYAADIYGQGVGYWYSVGMLLDVRGEDTYRVYQYGQGSGIHLSLGLLADGAGNDLYYGHILSQGNAHDFGVGMLLDHGGRDSYVADEQSQGRAINNALAILLDGGGRDAYLARDTRTSQGIGHDGGTREYGSLSLLLDLGGKDTYAAGVADGERRPRPDFGIVYDSGTGEAR